MSPCLPALPPTSHPHKIDKAHPGLVTTPAGSVAAGVATHSSDLDLVLCRKQLPGSRSPLPGGDAVAELNAVAATAQSQHSHSTVTARSQHGHSTVAELNAVAATLRAACGMAADVVVAGRAKAPSVIKCKPSATGRLCGVTIDVTIQPQGASRCASADKASMIRSFSDGSDHFRPMALLIKGWAGARGLIDPARGKLNSFTLTLMVARYLQHTGELGLPDCDPADLMPTPRTTEHAESLAQHADVGGPPRPAPNADPLGTVPPLPAGFCGAIEGFFLHWMDFDYGRSVCSVRLGAELPRGARPADDPATAALFPFVLEDPLETAENTARTLAAKNLQLLRAELNRAWVMLGDSHRWSAVCAPASKTAAQRRVELRPFLLPERPAAVASTAAEAPDGSALECIRQFARTAPENTSTRLEPYFAGPARRSMHHLADILGITLRKVGKRRNGRHQVQLTKPRGWMGASASHSARRGASPSEDEVAIQATATVPADKMGSAMVKTSRLLAGGLALGVRQLRRSFWTV